MNMKYLFITLLTLLWSVSDYAQLTQNQNYPAPDPVEVSTDLEIVDLLVNPLDSLILSQIDSLPHALKVDFSFAGKRTLKKRKVKLTVQITDDNFSTNTFEVRAVKTNAPYILDLSEYLSAGMSANVRVYSEGFYNALSYVYMDKGKIDE